MSDVFGVVDYLLSSQEYSLRVAFLSEAFKRTVVNSFEICFRTDDAFIVRIKDDDIGILNPGLPAVPSFLDR